VVIKPSADWCLKPIFSSNIKLGGPPLVTVEAKGKHYSKGINL